jgi:signal transduction histidine kinase/chemotaxis methyl-accepting protein methylase
MIPSGFEERAFLALTREVLLPHLLRRHKEPEPTVRIWSIGCQTGDEALLLLLCLANEQPLSPPASWHFTVFATDLDTQAVSRARGMITPSLLDSYAPLLPYRHLFERGPRGTQLPRTLRDGLIFAPHDLVSQMPFPHLDLIVCHRSLSAFTAEQQTMILHRFAYALVPHGLLLLLVPDVAFPETSLYHRLEAGPVLCYERTRIPVGPRVLKWEHLTSSASRSSALEEQQAAQRSLQEGRTILQEELQAALEEVEMLSQELEERTQESQQIETALGQLATIVSSSGDAIFSHDLTDRSRVSQQTGEELRARLLLDTICQVLGCERAVMAVLQPETEVMSTMVTSGFDRQSAGSILEQVRGESLAQSLGNPAIMTQLREGYIVSLNANRLPHHQREISAHLKVVLLIPMRLGSVLVGIIILYPSQAHLHTLRKQQALLAAVGSLAALLTERIRLVQEREEARARELAAKEAARQMDAFLGIVSHELKSPLTAIQGYLQLAELKIRHGQPLNATPPEASGEQRESVLRLIELALWQLNAQTRVVNDLIDSSRIQAGRLELQVGRCNLVQFVQEAVEHQRMAAPNRQIELHTPVSELPILADAQRVGQVIANYLLNALKYSEASRPVQVSISLEGQMARVAVRDEGPGLSPEQQQRVWERFYRVPTIEAKTGSGVGLGLGLHICKLLIEHQGGQVGVQSTPGHGSTFWFTLPLAQEEATR